VGTYTIGEAAQRSGFTASALRYYEGIGLVLPTTRTDGGSRLYDDRALARLAFIGRAKQLGCSMEEIIALVEVWTGERCGPVQQRLHELVTDKIRSSQRQLADLTALTAQLQVAAGQLSAEPLEGPCDETCACVSARAQSQGANLSVNLATKPADPPVACTLGPEQVPQRLAAWQGFLDHVRTRSATADGGIRVEFDDTVDAGALARLAAAEQRCCAFFSFSITVDVRGTALEVRAPDAAADLVTGVFGSPAT
jgi:DNA-binding transcriptional MerR regulator